MSTLPLHPCEKCSGRWPAAVEHWTAGIAAERIPAEGFFMSDVIPPPSDDSVNLEDLRPFQADYLELQNVEEKKVLLQMQQLLTGYHHRLRRVFNAIGLEGRLVMPLDDQIVIQAEWAFHDVMLDGQTILSRVAANPPELTPKRFRRCATARTPATPSFG